MAASHVSYGGLNRMRRKGAKLKLQEDIESGLAHIKITSNNTIVTISRLNGTLGGPNACRR